MISVVALALSITVSGAWSRPADGIGVVYCTIVNHGAQADRLIGAASSASNMTEVHESMEMSNGGGMGPMVTMHRVASIVIPAHGTVVLKPGGYHVMLIDLKRNLRAGMYVPVRLHFARAGWITTVATVRAD